MEIIKINNNPEDLNLLSLFIDNLGIAAERFRYFQKRPLNVIEDHLVTLLVTEEGNPIGYGHLDKDSEKIWLGISITPAFQGKGIGKELMNALILEAQKNNVNQIVLTVDNDNTNAQILYERFNFVESNSFDNPNVKKYILTLKNE